MCRGNYETQDNRIALEKKSKEFKKAGKILMMQDIPHYNSAAGRYYYSIYIRIVQLMRILNKINNIEDRKDSHQYTIRLFNQSLQQEIAPKMSVKNQHKVLSLINRLENCSKYRIKTDYKEIFLNINNVNFLKKTLNLFDEIYDETLEVLEIEKYEK
ncbi:hypothetical protein JMUB4039_1111 [Leptotrichia trevisanii]|jgi:hypothetical protein|uniref:hypothetical protein n=1 Tax=Leptotrichia trevisanii TaxID=109328 RepID=UPI00118925D4|nr:hypothetical protein [Leptotrichia trevisanii]BBM57133.1 hypothetical protein JMUB4039_1111 [Leptotrichia trevisanii]